MSSPDGNYLQAVARLRQYLLESDSTDRSIFSSGSKKDDHEADLDLTAGSQGGFKSRKSLFVSSTPKVSRRQAVEDVSNEHQLFTLIQRQFIYTGALQKELQFYRKEAQSLAREFQHFVQEVLEGRSDESRQFTESLFAVISSVSERKREQTQPLRESTEQQLRVELASVERQLIQLKETYLNHQCSNSSTESNQLLQTFRREQVEWKETEDKLRSTITVLQQRENDALRQVQQSVEVAEQAQLERAQMEKEVRRLAGLVELHEKRVTELNSEITRQDQRYSEQLASVARERDVRDGAITRMSVDLERAQRSESSLKNELLFKNTLLDNTRQELQRQLGQLQGELSRAAGYHAELQRRLGEAELRAEMAGKSSTQEAALARAEVDLWRRKAELLEKELADEKNERNKIAEELSQKIKETRMLAPAAEEEKARLLRYNTQVQSVARFLEQREISLLSALQSTEKQNAMRLEEYSKIVDDQRQIIEELRNECRSLTDTLEKCASDNSATQEKLEKQLAALTAELGTVQMNYETVAQRNQHLVQELLRITKDTAVERA